MEKGSKLVLSFAQGEPIYMAWEWNNPGPNSVTNFHVTPESSFTLMNSDGRKVMSFGFYPNLNNRLTWDGKEGVVYCVAAIEDTSTLPVGNYTYSLFVESMIDDKKILRNLGELEITP